MDFYGNVRNIILSIFFPIFFQFYSDLLSFFSQSFPLIVLSSLPHCCISVLSYPYPASPIQRWLPVGLENLIQRSAVLSWQAGSQSFLFVSNPMHYFKSDWAFLPESLHQHNVSLFSHLSHPLPLHVLLHSQASACCCEVSWQWTSSPAGRGTTVS